MGEITKGQAGVRWDNVVEKIWKDFGGEQERVRLALRNKVKEEKHLEIYGGLREDIVIKTYLRRPMDYAKKLKLRFRVREPGPTRKKTYTSSREKDVANNMCPCGTTIESRTHRRRM